MIKQFPIIEIKRDDRNYLIILPLNAQAGEVYDVLSEARAHVHKIICDIQAADQKKEEPKSE